MSQSLSQSKQDEVWGELQAATETGTLTELLTHIKGPAPCVTMRSLFVRVIGAGCLVMLCPVDQPVTIELTVGGELQRLTIDGPIELSAYKASRALHQCGPFATDPTRRGGLREIPD